MPKAPLVALVLAAGLAGCGMFATNAPKVSSDLVDGSYQGRERLVSGHPPACPKGKYGVLVVGDGTLFVSYAPGTVFTVPVLPDGSLHAEMDRVVLDGRLAGNRLVFTVTSPQCRSAYHLDFIWNHS